jgi:hypothetical protein
MTCPRLPATAGQSPQMTRRPRSEADDTSWTDCVESMVAFLKLGLCIQTTSVINAGSYIRQTRRDLLASALTQCSVYAEDCWAEQKHPQSRCVRVCRHPSKPQ